MKEFEKTIIVFEAQDGTCFEKKENCERYEDRIKLKNLKKSLAWLEKQGKQNPADEPKFKVNDWCIDDEYDVIYQIVKVLDNTYTYRTTEGEEYSCTHYSLEDTVRLWTIQDAKDGDILAINWNEGDDYWEKIIIFKKYHNKGVEGLIDSPCVEGYGNTFKNGKLVFHEEVPYYSKTWTNCLHPATKKQRELLFQRMKEAIYEWMPIIKN